MEGDEVMHRSICCRRQLSADSQRSNGKLGIVAVGVGRCRLAVGGVYRMANFRDNLMFYLLKWIYFGINTLENSATT